VDRGELHVHGAYFGVATGRLLVRDPETGRFEPVANAGSRLAPMIRCD
jgi:carbonic anhydrase